MADHRDRLRFVRRLAGWPLVALLAAIAFALGYAGFELRLGAERSSLDIAYLALQLFTVESGNAAGPSPPVVLEIARFLAPATTAYALGRAVAQLFRAQIEQWRLRTRRGHVIVVGLGWLGLELVERLVDQDFDVVAISLDLDDEAVASVRRSRVPVVIGDARDPDVLREARADHATHLVVLAGADEISAEIALAARELIDRPGPRSLVCLAHIGDPQLCRILRAEALLGPAAAGFRLEFFNVAEEAAAIMLDEHASGLADPRPGTIGVVGGNDVAASVVSEAARTRRMHGRDPVRIVVADSSGVVARLRARFPQLPSGAEIETIEGPDVLADSAIEQLSGCDVVFVCLDEDTVAISTSLLLAERLTDTPVVVALGHWAGMASMLSSDPARGRPVHPFLIPDRLLGADLLLAGLGERLAREVHAAYVAERRASDPDAADPALAEWRDLREEYRQSSRAQAAHLSDKLRAIGCGAAPATDWDAPPASLTDDEIETLARLEHERWTAERLADGWKPGPRDADARTSPYLVPWDDLTGPDGERVRDLDRVAARAVPGLLARAGYRLIRRGADDVRP